MDHPTPAATDPQIGIRATVKLLHRNNNGTALLPVVAGRNLAHALLAIPHN